MTHPKYTDEIIEAARLAWVSGEPVVSIVQRLDLANRKVVYRWRDKLGWENQRAPESALLATTRRYNALIEKDCKSDADWKEINILTDIVLRFEKMSALANGGSAGPGRTPGVKNGQGKKRKKKNDIDHITPDDFIKFEAGKDHKKGCPNLYPHQLILIRAGEDPEFARRRFLLKGRQEGATYLFAYEAFKTMCTKGHNQIFISSTKAQAEIFKSYMSIIARLHFDVELSGNPITLSNGAEAHFLSPNSFADSRSGDVYFDECFKTRQWKKMEAIAEPMATLKKFKTTYFSSPTAISHEAYEIWSGERYTSHHPDAAAINVDVPKKGDCDLTYGRLDSDGIWRCALTIHDCIRMGWDQVDLEDLKRKMPDPELFAVTYECQFVNDANSTFNLKKILACGVDVTTAWPDYNPTSDRPIGNIECTAGYDPAGIGDNASFVTLTIPRDVAEKFRLLEADDWRGIGATMQVDMIRDRAAQYNYGYCEIDATGPGLFLPSFVQPIISNVVEAKYSPLYKTLMVQKALSIIDAGRFEYDENDTMVPLAFLTVYQTATEEQGVITYKSRRHKGVGHGDRAWACMHAFMCEELNPADAGTMRVKHVQ